MTTKHTQGTLTVRASINRSVKTLVANEENKIVCDTFKAPFEEAEANARLIAAAPELLEACKRGLACALSLDDKQSVNDAEVLRSAIAKAGGKQFAAQSAAI